MRFLKMVVIILIPITMSTIPLHATDMLGLSVSVSISPVEKFPQDYICLAEIIELGTEKVIATPKLVFARGGTGRSNIGDVYGSLTIEVSVNKEGTIGSYIVTYKKDGVLKGIQKGKISVQ